MRYYFSLVYEALNQEVAPFLRETIEPALCVKYGNDWYSSYGLSIMKKYSNLKDIEEGMSAGLKPLVAMDITALCFFLFPYGEDEGGNGAIDVLVEYYKWDEWQFRKIERIRRIRNKIAHETYEKNFVLSDENIVNGIQEKAWLN